MSQMAMKMYSYLKGDKWIWAIMVFLSIVSLLAVYSASKNIAYSGGIYSTEYYLVRQTVMIFLGLTLAYIVSRIHFMHFWKLTPYLYFGALFLLIYTFFNGVETNDATRWIRLPFIGITFQASDLAKVALIMMVARLLSQRRDIFGDENKFFWVIIAFIVGITMAIAPMDLSTAGMLFIACITLMIVGRVSTKYIAGIFGVFIIGILLIIAISTFFPDSARTVTWANRLSQFFSAGGDTFQVKLSKIAIANGGVFGLGPGNTKMAGILPSSYSDFIYAVICEEYGVIGAVLILVAYIGLLTRVTVVVSKCTQKFGALMAYGLCILILIQAFFNIAVSLNLVPVTGLTLPMVSRGGTSTLLTSLAFGIILSVSNHNNTEHNKEDATRNTDESDT